MYGGCPLEVRRSIIEDATAYGYDVDNALYGLACFDLYDEHLYPKGAIFTDPTIDGFKDIVYGHGALYFNRSRLGELPLLVTDDPVFAFKTAYPVYAPLHGNISEYTLKSLMKAHADVCFIASIGKK
ncbi:MAG: hypothetical protein EOO01_42415, partial [Chitinophagaceae bacterium]